MAMFGTSGREAYDALYPVLNQPPDLSALEREQKPSFFESEGQLRSLGTGAYLGVSRGAAFAADAFTPTLRPIAKTIDEIFGSKTDEWLLGEQEKTRRALVESKLDPKTNGTAAQVLFGLGDVLTTVLSTAGNPQAAGIVYGYGQYQIGRSEGLDPTTAGLKAGIEGGAMGVSVALPAAIPGGLAFRAASGAALNVGVGIPERLAVSTLLRERGYEEMARQYDPLDSTAIITEIVLGATFGGLLGPRARTAKLPPAEAIPPSVVDAALTANQQRHAEIDTAPGIPTDTRSRQAHTVALDQALDSLASGRPVEVEQLLRDTNFAQGERALEDAEVQAIVRAELERAGATDAAAEFDRMVAEAQGRGVPGQILYQIRRTPGDEMAPMRITAELSEMVQRARDENWETGRLIDEADALLGRLRDANAAKAEARASAERVRGDLWLRERLTRAERTGEITPENARLALWLLDQNPNLANDLGISLRQAGDGQVAGEAGGYNPANRVITILKGRANDETAAHEILHHAERMMPEEVQAGIQAAWRAELKALRDVATRTQNLEMMQAVDDAIRGALGDMDAFKRLAELVATGKVSEQFYALANPSEFWAVNGSRILRERASEAWVQRAAQWLKEFIEKVKDAFGLRSDAAVIRGLEAVLKSDGEFVGTPMLSERRIPFFQVTARSVQTPGKDVAQENLNGFEPDLRVRVPMGKITLPEKPLVLTGTNKKNAARQIAGIDETLTRFPNADKSPLEWSRMMAYAMAVDDVPIPPYRFLEDINGDGAFNSLSRLTKGQIEDANHGFENAAAFRQAYVGKELDVETTGKLFMWSFLSRGVSPYVQEGLFIDAFPGIDKWIKKAAAGEFTEADFPAYRAWASSVAPKGSGQPGSGATHNLNAFGELFLFKMGQRDADGMSLLQKMHDMMEDPAMTGQQLRRWFTQNTEGVGIDNKVVSFTLLVAGFKDVMVLDRVQIRQLWDDGRFAGRNLYDGRKVDGKPVAGSMLSEITYGARGLLIYEAIERALAKRIEALYTRLGRPEDASIGRYHWETWVADSQQEASHGTLDAILHSARGDLGMIAEVTAKEGEYGAYQYGARYGRTAAGEPYFRYQVNDGPEFLFTVQAFQEFMVAIKSPRNRVVPSGFKVTEAGNAPWYQRAEVDRQRLQELAAEYAVTGQRSAGEGAGALRQAEGGQALPDQPGRGAPDLAAAVSRELEGGFSAGRGDEKLSSPIEENPTMQIPDASGQMVPAAQALEAADAEIARAGDLAKGMPVAADCALRFGGGQ